MYQLYAERSPNVFKVALLLEELNANWSTVWTDVTSGMQFSPEFLAMSPNGKIPLLIDEAPVDGGRSQVVWESGAILQYLAEKHNKYLARDVGTRTETMIWLFWQMAGLGPMTGQHAHFTQYQEILGDVGYAAKRYKQETKRLFDVLNAQLSGRAFIVGEYSIADMAVYPWIRLHDFLDVSLAKLPEIRRWFEEISARPATARAYAKIEALPNSTKTLEQRYQTMCGLHL